jgi:peptidoglycan-N-acetylmuramic acid deacetylase
MKTYPFQKLFPVFLLLAMAFFAGRGFAEFVENLRGIQEQHKETIMVSKTQGAVTYQAQELQDGTGITQQQENQENLALLQSQQTSASAQLQVLTNWPFTLDSPLLPGTENWGLGFGTAGSKPAGNATPEEMKTYNAYYVAPGEERKIYLTFDCGYENGNTEAILDALKKHHATATFFVVGHFLESAPELVKRMVAEGHTVGDHTYHHPDMSKISDLATFQKEMDDVRTKFFEVTGQEMPMYYRPPQGKYNKENLQMAKDLGYATFFWSLAYVDWNVNDQPTHEEAFSKLTSRIHPGAIVLLHNTSKTNAEILDELLTKWEEMGYAFGNLEEITTLSTSP